MTIPISSSGEHAPAGNGPLTPADIQLEDCTVALLAGASLGDKEALQKLERRVSEDHSIGCIACNCKIAFDKANPDGIKGAQNCKATFSKDARRIVTPHAMALIDGVDAAIARESRKK